MRFCELQHAVGVNPRTLAQRLRFLQEEGLIELGAPGGTPRYALTLRGAHLVPVLDGLRDWQSRWLASTMPPAASTHQSDRSHHEVDLEQN
jgi:DNA-binding HxlR family transcriptional regulator